MKCGLLCSYWNDSFGGKTSKLQTRYPLKILQFKKTMIKKYFFKFLIFLFFFANAFSQAKPLPPSYLTVELLEHPERVFITDFTPEFGWVMTSDLQNNYQTAYQILVASSKDSLAKNVGAWWDTGKIKLNHSINIEYAGKQLMPNSNYYWQVRTWDRENNSSDY